MLDGLFFGTATQGEAARRGRPRGAVREQEDEDAQGHDDGLRRRAAAPAELRAAVCSALAEQALIGDRAGLRRLNPRDRPATACGEGCERSDAGVADRRRPCSSLLHKRGFIPHNLSFSNRAPTAAHAPSQATKFGTRCTYIKLVG